MKRVYSNHKALIGSGGTGRYIAIPCSETDIIDLEKMCMNPGVHHIQVQSITSGRQLIINVLSALAWHQDIGYITVEENAELQKLGTNIIKIFDYSLDQEALESFFINAFYFDFLLLENSTQLQAMPWIDIFEQQLIMYKIDQMIPIIVLDNL